MSISFYKADTMRWLLMTFLLLPSARSFTAPVGDICLSCQQRIRTNGYLLDSRYYKESQVFCANCVNLKTKCAICDLPFAKYVDLKDGRILCLKDAKTAILSSEDAENIFNDVKRDVIRMLAGSKSFPDRNIIFNLVDHDELKSLSRIRRFPQTHNVIYGLTRSRATNETQFEHHIDILSGITRGQFIGACAHEYGHAWMEQNLVKDRAMDADAVEGFCELLAWKMTGERGESLDQQFIRENKYTQGQIDAFIQAEQDYNFYRVMKWVIAGRDAKFSVTNTAPLIALMEDPLDAASGFVWPPPQAARPPAPDTLILKAISGSAKRRFALVNGATLGVNETAKIRIGTSNILVRCIEIKDSSVLLQLPGATNRTELFLPKASAR